MVVVVVAGGRVMMIMLIGRNRLSIHEVGGIIAHGIHLIMMVVTGERMVVVLVLLLLLQAMSHHLPLPVNELVLMVMVIMITTTTIFHLVTIVVKVQKITAPLVGHLLPHLLPPPPHVEVEEVEMIVTTTTTASPIVIERKGYGTHPVVHLMMPNLISVVHRIYWPLWRRRGLNS